MNFPRNVRRAAKAAGVAVTLGLGLGLGLTVAAPAQADPPVGTFTPLVGVCSDTVEPVLDALGEGYFSCFGSSGSPIIQTRPAGCRMARPTGSSAAIDALRKDIDTRAGCLDFAGVARGPIDTSTQDLSWIQFAMDGVTAAVRGDSPLSSHPFTLMELQRIYTCETTQAAGITVNPLLPQPGSDARVAWLAALRLSEVQLGSCVGGSAPENNGTVLTSAGHIVPFSISSYLAQTDGPAPDARGEAVLVPMDGVEPISGSGTFNTDFPHVRRLYVVVDSARVENADIKAAFIGPTSKLCDSPAVIRLHGFGTLSNCGTVAATGER
ncbi:hypothetical protein ACIRQP_02485 [Streptomyces sp. NPDC102274]|uniref:hypothetical protein n=1 Tax=Streptomyces sp. NPDC102274 TaxID=3366151 RepID=UPI0037FBC387